MDVLKIHFEIDLTCAGSQMARGLNAQSILAYEVWRDFLDMTRLRSTRGTAWIVSIHR